MPDRVRWHLFEPPEQTLTDDLEAQRLKWEAYQCQDLMQVACAALLAWAIAIINSAPHGRSLPEIRAEIIEHFAAREEDMLLQSWRDMRMALRSADFAYEDAWDTLISARGAAADKALVAIELMAALQQRLADRSDLAAAAAQGLPDRGSAHSLLTEISWLQRGEGEAVADLIADYMLDRVVRRHSWVAMQKLRRQRDYTFLFEQRDNRFVYLGTYQPVATTPRLQPTLQFLADIHLLDENGPTALGLAALERAQ